MRGGINDQRGTRRRVSLLKPGKHASSLCLCVFYTIRAVTKLLEDLVFFVVDIPNNGQDVLEIMVNKPNRERQKLMREQNILKQVISINSKFFRFFGLFIRCILTCERSYILECLRDI